MRALADPILAAHAAPAPSKARWGDLRQRTASAVVLAPVVLLCAWYGGVAWVLLMAAAGVGLGYEWSALCRCKTASMPGLLLPTGFIAAAALIALGQTVLATVLLLAMAMAAWRLGGGWLAVGVGYIGLPLWALWRLRAPAIDADGRADLLFVMLVVWASDIGAYGAGRLFGGAKLAPSISPGKTRSGALGGLVVAMLVGEAAAQWLAPGAVGRAAVMAGVIAFASQVGDLFESWVKRRFGVKDSGWLIPGHGGLLDRLDGLLAAAPVAVALAMMFGHGGVLWK